MHRATFIVDEPIAVKPALRGRRQMRLISVVARFTFEDERVSLEHELVLETNGKRETTCNQDSWEHPGLDWEDIHPILVGLAIDSVAAIVDKDEVTRVIRVA
jgi:hypothetical protein